MANRLKMKRKILETYLQEMDTLESAQLPRDAWYKEQYPTPPSITAEFLTEIQMTENAIEGKTIIDFGCGSGPLAIGCVLLGAKHVTAVDIDNNCVQLTQKNADDIGITEDLLTCRVVDIRTVDCSELSADTIVMNPPFGTKFEEGIDRIFVNKALQCVNVVYSFHKTSTRSYWTGCAKELKCTVKPLFCVRFPIDRLFQFHRQNSIDIDVDILKFVKNF